VRGVPRCGASLGARRPSARGVPRCGASLSAGRPSARGVPRCGASRRRGAYPADRFFRLVPGAGASGPTGHPRVRGGRPFSCRAVACSPDVHASRGRGELVARPVHLAARLGLNCYRPRVGPEVWPRSLYIFGPAHVAGDSAGPPGRPSHRKNRGEDCAPAVPSPRSPDVHASRGRSGLGARRVLPAARSGPNCYRPRGAPEVRPRSLYISRHGRRRHQQAAPLNAAKVRFAPETVARFEARSVSRHD
jgi:hypothetical protein